MFKLLLWHVILKIVHSEVYLEVKIIQGSVRGYKSSEGIIEFYGIPYASAPTGPDKFKGPLEPPTWDTPFEATNRSIACPQGTSANTERMNELQITIQEDCLVTNIFVPDTKETKLPVVVYFHGGAFQYGYGEELSPKELVKTGKIIALTFNYRLGPNGFLCLGTKDIPGNAGMKDQVALLRWVQKNIAYFGGDPDSVTLSGCSAGGASIDLHIISKISKGLFNKAIPESGSSISAFSVQLDPMENAKTYAKLLKFYNVEDVQALEEFYKNASLSDLTSIDVMERLDASVVFTPCIELDVGGEIFLDNVPKLILEKGAYHKVPTLFGFTNMEGMTRLSYFTKWKDLMNENFSYFLPENLEFKSEKEKKRIADRIKRFYFGSRLIDEKGILKFVDYFTDVIFNIAVLKSIQLNTEAGNDKVFMYEYSFSEEDNNVPYGLRGSNHCAQSSAVLDEVDENDKSKEYKKMKSIMRDLWLNFIITGAPVAEGSSYPKWLAVKKNLGPYMSLNTTMVLKDKYNNKRVRFWDKIYKKYYRTPIPPTFKKTIIA